MHGTQPGSTVVRRTPMTYQAMHRALRANRGRAGEYRCIHPGCTWWAESWAWIGHDCACRRTDTRDGYAASWSPNPRHYVPLCSYHHRTLDRAWKGTDTSVPRDTCAYVDSNSDATLWITVELDCDPGHQSRSFEGHA